MPDSQIPSIIYGYLSSNDKPVGSIQLLITNNDTGETLTTTTGPRGGYAVDGADFTSGYTVGDSVTVSVRYETPTYSDNVTVENGKIELTQ